MHTSANIRATNLPNNAASMPRLATELGNPVTTVCNYGDEFAKPGG